MNTKTITIISIIAILLIAFITNPSKQKHVDKTVEVLFHNDSDLGILGGLVDTFYKPTIAPKVKVDNYYVFSISYLRLKENNKRMNIGIGLFGQVLSIVNENDLELFNKGNSTNSPKKKKKTTIPSTQTKQVKKETDKQTKDKLDNLIRGKSSEGTKNQNGTLDGN